MLNIIEREQGGRDNVVFKDLCDDHTSLLGAIGSDTRIKFQEDWSVIKKRSFKSYVALLDELEILPGVHTVRQIKSLGEAAYADEDDDDVEDNKQDDPDYVPEEKDTSNVKMEESNKNKDASSDKSSEGNGPARATTPPPAMRARIATPNRSPMRAATPIKKPDTNSTKDIESALDSLTLDDSPSLHIARGTEDDPFCFRFCENAWMHPYGFVIRVKENKKIGNRAHSVVEIFVAASADADDWTAAIVTEGPHAFRAIQFKGPAMGFWAEFFFSRLKHNENDPNSKILADYMLATYGQLGSSDKVLHYRLVFDEEELYLDNQVISHDEKTVHRSMHKLVAKPKAFKEKECINVGLTWEVALFDSNPKVLGTGNQGSAADLW